MANKTILYSAVFSFFVALAAYAGGELTTVEEECTAYYLGRSYPLPFGPMTCLEFGTGDSCDVKIDIYSCMNGFTKKIDSMHLIDMPLDQKLGPGKYCFQWDEQDTEGNSAPNGIYYYFIDIECTNLPLKISGFAKLYFVAGN